MVHCVMCAMKMGGAEASQVEVWFGHECRTIRSRLGSSQCARARVRVPGGVAGCAMPLLCARTRSHRSRSRGSLLRRFDALVGRELKLQLRVWTVGGLKMAKAAAKASAMQAQMHAPPRARRAAINEMHVAESPTAPVCWEEVMNSLEEVISLASGSVGSAALAQVPSCCHPQTRKKSAMTQEELAQEELGEVLDRLVDFED